MSTVEQLRTAIQPEHTAIDTHPIAIRLFNTPDATTATDFFDLMSQSYRAERLAAIHEQWYAPHGLPPIPMLIGHAAHAWFQPFGTPRDLTEAVAQYYLLQGSRMGHTVLRHRLASIAWRHPLLDLTAPFSATEWRDAKSQLDELIRVESIDFEQLSASTIACMRSLRAQLDDQLKRDSNDSRAADDRL